MTPTEYLAVDTSTEVFDSLTDDSIMTIVKASKEPTSDQEDTEEDAQDIPIKRPTQLQIDNAFATILQGIETNPHMTEDDLALKVAPSTRDSSKLINYRLNNKRFKIFSCNIILNWEYNM